MKTAILFVTHIQNESIDKQIRILYEQTKGEADLFVGYQADKIELKLPQEVLSFPFTIKELNALGYRTWGCTLMDGNFHFVMLDFYHRYPDYDHYWLIEYDVRFNGDWRIFFSFFKDKDEDFITSHIKNVEEEPDWIRWHEIEMVNLRIDKSMLLKSFNPICRFSRKSLQLLHERCLLGDRGHNELLMPTLFQYYKLKMADFGGEGRHIYQDYPNLFYCQNPADKEDEKCTHRFRPAHKEEELALRNMIYHPIK